MQTISLLLVLVLIKLVIIQSYINLKNSVNVRNSLLLNLNINLERNIQNNKDIRLYQHNQVNSDFTYNKSSRYKSILKSIGTFSKNIFSSTKRKIVQTLVYLFIIFSVHAKTAIATTTSSSSVNQIDNFVLGKKINNSKKYVNRKAVIELVSSKSNDEANSINRQSTLIASNPSLQQQNVQDRFDPTVEVQTSWKRLVQSLEGAKLDTLIMLIATSVVIPVFTSLKTSPILGFMLTGTLLGPNGLNCIRDVHMIDKLGELGIVFFLFEMGLELSLERLKAMRKDVFGLGTSQFLVTSLVGSGLGIACGLPTPAAVTIGGSLALSSSAFVLQLLKDKNDMGTRHGKASFGILLLQDLAVVPLLVVVELLGKGGAGLGRALAVAGVKALVTLSTMSFMGRTFLNPIFSQVAKSGSHEAFLSIILTTVLLMSYVTHGIGLSDTLGAFLAGLLLSETSYHYQVEADIAPFRGLLLGLFFITVGFSIDLKLLVSNAPLIGCLLITMLIGKSSIITLLSLLFGIPLASAQQTGLLNAQGGELAFVAFSIAEKSGMISPKLCKILLTTVALSMALTPLLAETGAKIAKKIEENMGLTHYMVQDVLDPVRNPAEIGTITTIKETDHKNHNDFVFICGYGKVGQMICDMLDRQFISYIVVENSPQKAIEARNKGLPVYFGDINRPEMLKSFNVGNAKACILTLEDMSTTNKAVIRLRKEFPKVPIIARAKNLQHQQRLEAMFDDVFAMAPVLPEDSMLLSLPFASAVLRNIGVSRPEIDAIIEDVRKAHFIDDEDEYNDEEESDNSDKKKFNRMGLMDIFRKKDTSGIISLKDTTKDIKIDINNNNIVKNNEIEHIHKDDDHLDEHLISIPKKAAVIDGVYDENGTISLDAPQEELYVIKNDNNQTEDMIVMIPDIVEAPIIDDNNNNN